MRNDTTELIFEGEQHRVSLDAMQKVCAEMAAAAAMATARLTGTDVKVSFDVVASPVRGSIIIAILPVFHFSLDFQAMLSRAVAEVRPYLGEIGSLAGIGSLVWTVIFGGNGLFQLLKHKKELPDPNRPGASAVEVYLERTLMNDEDRQFRFQLQQVVHVAAGANVRAVKVRVSGDETVVLWDQSSRTEPGLLFSAHPFNRPPPAFIRRVSKEVISASYEGKPVKIFVGEGFVQENAGINRVVVIWASGHPVPETSALTATFVRGRILLDQRGLEIRDDIPRDFEGADAVIVVHESANMG